MQELLKSASKIVFILMALATVVGLFAGKVDAKDFMVLVSMSFTFYFSFKGNTDQPFSGK